MYKRVLLAYDGSVEKDAPPFEKVLSWHVNAALRSFSYLS